MTKINDFIDKTRIYDFNEAASAVMNRFDKDWNPDYKNVNNRNNTVNNRTNTVNNNAGTYGKTTTSLPNSVQEDLKEISKVAKQFNNAVKRMEQSGKYNKQRIQVFKDAFRSKNPELYDLLKDPSRNGQLKTGLKQIRTAIEDYHEDKGYEYNERTMLADTAEEFASDFKGLSDAGFLRPKEFMDKYYNLMNTAEIAFPNIDKTYNASLKDLNPEMKALVMERFIENEKISKYAYLKSDERILKAFDELSEEIEEDMQRFSARSSLKTDEELEFESLLNDASLFSDNRFR